MNAVSHTANHRSPVPAILGSILTGAALAIVLVLTIGGGGSEPSVTGAALLAFGLGWGLVALTTARFSAQPQAWARVPAAILGTLGLALIAVQPGPAVMDLLSWIWPPALAGLAVWMVSQVRSGLHGRGRWLVAPVIATLLAFAVGGGLTTIGTVGTSVASAAGGRLIDVGGHRLFIECTGSGGPAVILQAGMGAGAASWAEIAPTIAATTTVCAYDRAGHGHSDEVSAPQDGIALASDLHTLLQRAGVPGPYVLVAHSSGGPYVQVFAARYPDDVAGMVLLDPQPADAFTALPQYPGIYGSLKLAAVLSTSLARIGLLGPVLGLPADEATVAITRGARDEILALPATLDQAAALTSIGDRPLILVTAVIDSQPGWLAAHDNIAHLSSASIHRVMPNATHNSLISGADVPASAQAVLDVLGAIRNGRALR